MFFRPSASGTFTVNAASTDAQSGIKAGIAGYTFGSLNSKRRRQLRHQPDQRRALGHLRRHNHRADHAAHGQQHNGSGLSSAAGNYNVTQDSTGPTGGSISVPAFSSTLGSIVITSSNYTDAGAGIASNVITRSNAQAPSSPGVCPAGGYSGAIAASSPDTVPTDGQCYQYTLTGTDHVGNTATVTSTILVDTTVPSTPTVTFSGLSAGNTYDNGAGTLFFRPSAAGTFTVNAASTDTQSGIKAGNAGYTFGSLNTNGGTNFGSAQASGALSVTFTGATTGPTTQRTVSSTNGSGLNSAAGNYNVTQDSTGPTGGAASVPAFSSTLGSIVITTTNYSDAGSGIASNVITRSNAQAPSSPGVCPAAGYSGSTVVTSPDTAPTDGQCYVYTLTGTDHVGNSASVATSPILVDTTVPSTPTVTFTGLSAGNTYDNGAGTLFFRPSAAGTFTVNAASTDAQSGIQAGNAGYTFGSLNSNGGTNFGTAQASGALSVTFTGATTGPTTQRTVSSNNGSGLSSAAGNYNVTQDSTAPTGGSISVPAFSNTLGSIVITSSNYTDAGSGIASNSITRSNPQAPSSPGVCPAAGTFTGAIAASSPDTVPTDGQCYLYTLTGTDHVGNTATVTSTILVDTTVPSTPTVTFSGLSAGNTYDNGAGTLFFRPSAGGTFTVNAASTDAQSGIQAGNAGYTFGTLNSNGGTNFGSAQASGALSVTFTGTTTGPTTQRTVNSTNGAGQQLGDRQLQRHPRLHRPDRRRRSRCPPSRATLGSIVITTTNYSDAGSGIASNVITRSNAQAPSSPGVCPPAATAARPSSPAPTPPRPTASATSTPSPAPTTSATPPRHHQPDPRRHHRPARRRPSPSPALSAGNTYDNGTGTVFFKPSAAGTFTVNAASHRRPVRHPGRHRRLHLRQPQQRRRRQLRQRPTNGALAVTFDGTATGPTDPAHRQQHRRRRTSTPPPPTTTSPRTRQHRPDRRLDLRCPPSHRTLGSIAITHDQLHRRRLRASPVNVDHALQRARLRPAPASAPPPATAAPPSSPAPTPPPPTASATSTPSPAPTTSATAATVATSPILVDTTAPSTPTVTFTGLSAGNTYDNGAGTPSSSAPPPPAASPSAPASTDAQSGIQAALPATPSAPSTARRRQLRHRPDQRRASRSPSTAPPPARRPSAPSTAPTAPAPTPPPPTTTSPRTPPPRPAARSPCPPSPARSGRS